jgi:beta-glucosidase-like glycosyl hydrolase
LHSPKFVIVIRMLRLCLRAAFTFVFIFCAAGGSATDKDKNNKGAGVAKERVARPIHLDKAGRAWADRTLRRMSAEEKVGQLFMIWAKVQFMNDADPIWVDLRDKVRKYHIGSLGVTVPTDGALLFKSQPYEAAELLNRLQKTSKLPLIFAADFERGVSMRLNGTTVFPHAMAFGATGKPEEAEEFGRITALEARAIGVHWNFFPDADVNSNPANPIINTRSFGGDPEQVGDFVAAYIKGAHEGAMLTTAKHFPGHGDTGTDSHLGVAQVTGDRARLESVELPPFKRAIAAGVDAVMVAHVTVPALDAEPNRVATTSKAVVTGLLKEEMGFKGIVVTDALDMGALTRLYASDVGRAAVEAFKAGNDLLIIPADLDASYRDMVLAVKSGEIRRERLDEQESAGGCESDGAAGGGSGEPGGGATYCGGSDYAGAGQRARAAGEKAGNSAGRTSVSVSDRGAESYCCGDFFGRYAHRVRAGAGAGDSGSRAGCAHYLYRSAIGGGHDAGGDGCGGSGGPCDRGGLRDPDGGQGGSIR